MTSEDVNDDFDQVLDTVHQLVGGSNTSRSELINNIGSGKKDSAEEKWKQWKTEHQKDGELSVNDDPDEEVGTTEKEDINTEASHQENLLDNTENSALKATAQSDPSLDQDINGNPDLVFRLDYRNDFEQKRSPNDCGLEEDQAEHGDPQISDGGMIELSACGTVDPVVMQAFDDLDEAIIVKEEDGDSVCDMIDLSSDEETEENRDVSVVLLKRPPVKENVNGVANDTIQIDDSDEEFPIFLDEAEKQENFNVEEKRGYVKDFIEREGLGILSAENYGLVLFHLSHVWINGQQLSTDRVRSALTLGLWVSFYDQTLTGEQYSALSGEGVCHQAICVWTGRRPDHLLRTLDNLGPEYIQSLTSSREGFLLYLSGEVFLPLALARVRGVVVGYVSDNVGIIEAEDGHRNKANVFFHTDHVWIFKKPLRQYQEDFNCSPGRLLPAGLAVSVDARRVNIPGVDSLNYQAVCVLGGTWPEVPAPTLLPGGPGTFTAAYDVPENSTFYYLELSLEAKLSKKIEYLQDVLQRSRGSIKFDWRHVSVINNVEDKDNWRSQFTRAPWRPKAPRDDSYIQDRRRVKHMFKAPPARVIKTKKELDDSSSVATAGSSVSYISDVDSHMSRPLSRASRYSESSSASSKSKRDWYNPNLWKHGGLRIKTEIKSELV